MSDLKNIYQYHNNSKHGYYSFAPGPGYLDWANQPDPFRKYEGADIVHLKQIKQAERPFFSEVLQGGHHLKRPKSIFILFRNYFMTV